MEENKETIADIIAEMLRRADEIERDCAEKMKRGEIASDFYTRELVADIRREADRLEAALKREVDKLNSAIQATVGRSDAKIDRLRREIAEMRHAGNAAKLREAIEAVLLAFNYGESTIVNKLPFSKLLPMLRKCIEALAEPSRNCDVYTANELKVKFSCELVSELPIANEHEKNLVTITAMGVIDTLFATTQEGGAK